MTKNGAMPPSSEPDWCTQVRNGSVTNTGNVTDDCSSSLSPICSLTDVLLYSHIHENSEVQNGRNIGLENRLLKTRAGLLAGFVDDKGQSNADFVGFLCLFWTVDHRKRLVLIATTIDGPSALDLANARKSSFHSSFRRTITKELCSAWGST